MASTLTAESVREEVRSWLQDNWDPDITVGEWWARLTASGYAAPTFPEDAFGRGYNRALANVVNEELAKAGAVGPPAGLGYLLAAPTIATHATDEQKKYWLQRILDGTDAWCQLFSEPGAGSDLAGLSCRAERDGDEFIVNGQKVWNSAAQWCDHGMLLARTNPDMPKHHGITFLLVEMDDPGIEVRPLIQATGAAHFNEVFFDNVRVPVANVLGDIDNGWPAARTVMANESAMIGGGGGGSTFALLRLLAEQFERTDDPVARQRLMECYVNEKTLNLLADRIMGAIRRRERPPVDPSILKLSIALNKAVTGQVAGELAGAAALQTDDEIGRWVGSELMSRYGISIGGGTNEVQRNNLAERALGLPKEPTVSRDTPWAQLLRS
jgi:alkylation response protein AidB-like acyl-CoA dehydrogenase